MQTTKKVGIVLAGIVLGLIISPAVAVSEAYSARTSVELIENLSISSVVKTVKIVGLDDVSFAPNVINIAKGDTISFLNVDGSDGGIDHTITSVKTATMEPDGAFDSGSLRVGETFKVTFHKPGVYEYIDSLYPTISGRITVM